MPPLLPASGRDGSAGGGGPRATSAAATASAVSPPKTQEQQDLGAEDRAVDVADVDRAEPQHVGADVHERDERLVEHGDDHDRGDHEPDRRAASTVRCGPGRTGPGRPLARDRNPTNGVVADPLRRGRSGAGVVSGLTRLGAADQTASVRAPARRAPAGRRTRPRRWRSRPASSSRRGCRRRRRSRARWSRGSPAAARRASAADGTSRPVSTKPFGSRATSGGSQSQCATAPSSRKSPPVSRRVRSSGRGVLDLDPLQAAVAAAVDHRSGSPRR